MPVESYQNKGLFEDLKPFIEKDEDLELDNFMPNIIEAFSSVPFHLAGRFLLLLSRRVPPFFPVVFS